MGLLYKCINSMTLCSIELTVHNTFLKLAYRKEQLPSKKSAISFFFDDFVLFLKSWHNRRAALYEADLGAVPALALKVPPETIARDRHKTRTGTPYSTKSSNPCHFTEVAQIRKKIEMSSLLGMEMYGRRIFVFVRPQKCANLKGRTLSATLDHVCQTRSNDKCTTAPSTSHHSHCLFPVTNASLFPAAQFHHKTSINGRDGHRHK